jgi:hypothetical protein
MKVDIDTIREGVYYPNCFNEGHFTKEYKLLMKFCQIYKAGDHNTNWCPSKVVSGSFPSKEIVPMHVVQTEIPIVPKQKKCQIILYQMIKINIIIDNIMQDPMVVIGKIIIVKSK